MASGRLIDRPVKARQEVESDYDEDALESSGGEIQDANEASASKSSSNETVGSDAEVESNDQAELSPEEAEENLGEEAALKHISFGALAEAQAALGPLSKKRKLARTNASTQQNDETNPNKAQKLDAQEQRRKPKEHVSRSSKHAPAIQSSRHAVSRRREVFEPSPALKSRDPRFDATVLSSTRDPSAADKANKNYSFLTAYQASEILDLKSQIKKSASDPALSATLKRQVMSLESKLRTTEARQREKEVLARHKAEEREAISSGRKEKPYYMKKSEVRKEVLVEKFNSMSKKARDKAVERKRKRTKGKEARDMPRTRREKEFVGS